MLIRLVTDNAAEAVLFLDSGNPDFSSIRRILHKYAPELFAGELVDIPSMVLYTNRGYKSTYRNDKGCSKNYEKVVNNSPFTEAMLSGEVASEDFTQMSEAIVRRSDGTEQACLYGIDMFEEGFIINTGKTSTNFLGMRSESYLGKITSTQLKCKTRDAARHFKDISDVLKYVKKHEEVFRFAVSQYDYQWSWEYASDVFKEFHHRNMTSKKQAAFEATVNELETLLSSINGMETEEPDHLYGNTQKQEAILRLEEFDVAPFIMKDFYNGKVQISDIGGIIFDLDDFAKEIVDHLKSEGHMPYLVLRNGPMYSVLMVNKNKECWPDERYDPRTELVLAYCTMTNMGLYGLEYGSIMVQKTAAGGLTRVE